MKTFIVGLSVGLIAVSAYAQTPPPSAPARQAPAPTATMAPPVSSAPTGSAGTAVSPAGQSTTTSSGATSGSSQAITTAGAGGQQPLKGANSFSQGQAQSRLKGKGFEAISALSKDKDGIWRGKATKGGQQVNVWVDYKGNVGQQ